MTINAEVCKHLSHAVYGDDLYKLATDRGFEKLLIEHELMKNGYFKGQVGCTAAAYQNKNTGEIVIAYRGTERRGLGDSPFLDPRDWISNAALMSGGIPSEYMDAQIFYDAVLMQYGSDYPITLTGHSLGGALASLIAATSTVKHTTFTFNAPGVRHLLTKLSLSTYGKYPYITNYSVMNDWCGMLNAHIGNLMVLPPIPMTSGGELMEYIDTHEKIHYADLSTAVNKPENFNESEGLSLWYYDAKNRNLLGAGAVLSKLASKASVESLEHALKILRNNPNLIEYDFTYKANGKTYYLPKANGKTIAGTTKAEILFGSSNDDILKGDSGNDELHGFEGNDTLYGGAGNDTLFGYEGNNVLHGGDGNDVLTGGDGDDVLYGEAGNDILYGGAGNDSLFGGSGNDVLYGDAGRDRLAGGSGMDYYILERYSKNVINDSDGKGIISYGGRFLVEYVGNKTTHIKPKRIPGEENKWSDGRYIYEYKTPNLIVDNSFTIEKFKNGDLHIMLVKEDGTPDPSVPGSGGNSGGGDGNGSGGGSGSGGGGTGGGNGSTGSGTGESNYDHDNEGNLITAPNPDESHGTYEIMEGDTIWGILFGLGYDPNDYEELIRLNPWLADRFSDDMKHCLIFPGEILILPKGKGAVKFEEDGEYEVLEPQPITTPDKDIANAGPPNTPPVDPLIFDLDFNGIISLSKPENGRNFDIDNDGIAQKVAWINSGDAILVCDRNGNGTIDNGLELFGDNTLLENGEYAKSGIEALAA